MATVPIGEESREPLSHYAFPCEHWLRTNNPLERILREIQRQTRVVGSFPDSHSALMFAATRLRHVSGSIAEYYPEALWQRCVVHFYRNVFTMVPRTQVRTVASMLKAIHAQEDRKEAEKKIETVAQKLEEMRLKKAATLVREGAPETLSYYAFPSEHWRSLRTNNPLERILREIRRRTRVVGSFPDGHSALMLAAARLRHVSGTKWGTRKCLDMSHLTELDQKTEAA